MKKYNKVLGLSIVISLIIVILLISSAMTLIPKNVVYNDFIISMNDWTYHTNISREEKSIKLPWVPDYKEDNVTIYMKSKLPDIQSRQCLLIKSYMKEIKVLIDEEVIYDSKLNIPKNLTKAIGRGVYFVDIPFKYSGKDIELQVASPLPQNQGVIKDITISNKAAHIMSLIKSEGSDNVIALAMVFVGLGAISIFWVTFFGGKRYINLLCIGGFAISCGMWIIGGSDLYQVVYNNSIVGYLIEFIGFYSIPIPLLIFIITTYKLKYRKIVEKLAALFMIFLITTLTCQISGVFHLHEFLGIYHCVFIISMAVLLVLMFSELKRKNKDFIVFFVGCSILVMFAVLDLFLFYIRPLKPITGFYKIGMGLFIIVLFIIIGRYMLRVAHKKIKNEMLMDLAYKDITTGLSNRRLFEEFMRDLNRSIDQNSNIAIIVVDLDNLKKTNDSKGHAVGDRLILLSAYILEKAYKDVGKAFRIGGDEFVILCEEKSILDIEKCHKKREILIKEYSEETENNIEMSCGIAFYNYETDKNIDDVFARADREMYRNKLTKKKMIEEAVSN